MRAGTWSLVCGTLAALAGCAPEPAEGVFACASERDCPSAWVCEPRPEDGARFCYRTPLARSPGLSDAASPSDEVMAPDTRARERVDAGPEREPRPDAAPPAPRVDARPSESTGSTGPSEGAAGTSDASAPSLAPSLDGSLAGDAGPGGGEPSPPEDAGPLDASRFDGAPHDAALQERDAAPPEPPTPACGRWIRATSVEPLPSDAVYYGHRHDADGNDLAKEYLCRVRQGGALVPGKRLASGPCRVVGPLAQLLESEQFELFTEASPCLSSSERLAADGPLPSGFGAGLDGQGQALVPCRGDVPVAGHAHPDEHLGRYDAARQGCLIEVEGQVQTVTKDYYFLMAP